MGWTGFRIAWMSAGMMFLASVGGQAQGSCPSGQKTLTYAYRDLDGDGYFEKFSGRICGVSLPHQVYVSRNGETVRQVYARSSGNKIDFCDSDPKAWFKVPYTHLDGDGDGYSRQAKGAICSDRKGLPQTREVSGVKVTYSIRPLNSVLDECDSDKSGWYQAAYQFIDADGDGVFRRQLGKVCSPIRTLKGTETISVALLGKTIWYAAALPAGSREDIDDQNPNLPFRRLPASEPTRPPVSGSGSITGGGSGPNPDSSEEFDPQGPSCCACIYDPDETSKECGSSFTSCVSWLGEQLDSGACEESVGIFSNQQVGYRKDFRATPPSHRLCRSLTIGGMHHGDPTMVDQPFRACKSLESCTEPDATIYYDSNACSMFQNKAEADAAASVLMELNQFGRQYVISANQLMGGYCGTLGTENESYSTRLSYIVCRNQSISTPADCKPEGADCNWSPEASSFRCLDKGEETIQYCCRPPGAPDESHYGKLAPPGAACN
jgi:hypothetical protein